MKITTTITSVLCAAALAACGGDDADGDLPSTVSLMFSDLPDLGDDFVYEGWVLVDGAPVSTGRFSVDGSAEVAVEQDFSVDAAPTAYILTIEPATGDDPAPAGTHVVAGDIANNAATLTVGHPAAISDDFSSAAGTFVLATPSSTTTADNNQGIWFLDPAGPDPSLSLPVLPAGWAYEGWVVDANGPVTTGVFTELAGEDSDGAGPSAGPESFPPFPGQDYIDPAMDLTDGFTAVITIEPDPDNSPMPFQLKPLVQPIDAGLVGPDNPQTFGNAISDNNITGTATFE